MPEPIDTLKQRLTEAIAWSHDPDDPDGTEELCNLIDAVEAYLIDLARIEDSSRESSECNTEFLASKGIFDEGQATLMMLYPFTPCNAPHTPGGSA